MSSACQPYQQLEFPFWCGLCGVYIANYQGWISHKDFCSESTCNEPDGSGNYNSPSPPLYVTPYNFNATQLLGMSPSSACLQMSPNMMGNLSQSPSQLLLTTPSIPMMYSAPALWPTPLYFHSPIQFISPMSGQYVEKNVRHLEEVDRHNKRSQTKLSPRPSSINDDEVPGYSKEEKLMGALWVHEQVMGWKPEKNLNNNFKERFGKEAPPRHVLMKWEKMVFPESNTRTAMYSFERSFQPNSKQHSTHRSQSPCPSEESLKSSSSPSLTDHRASSPSQLITMPLSTYPQEKPRATSSHRQYSSSLSPEPMDRSTKSPSTSRLRSMCQNPNQFSSTNSYQEPTLPRKVTTTSITSQKSQFPRGLSYTKETGLEENEYTECSAKPKLSSMDYVPPSVKEQCRKESTALPPGEKLASSSFSSTSVTEGKRLSKSVQDKLSSSSKASISEGRRYKERPPLHHPKGTPAQKYTGEEKLSVSRTSETGRKSKERPPLHAPKYPIKEKSPASFSTGERRPKERPPLHAPKYPVKEKFRDSVDSKVMKQPTKERSQSKKRDSTKSEQCTPAEQLPSIPQIGSLPQQIKSFEQYPASPSLTDIQNLERRSSQLPKKYSSQDIRLDPAGIERKQSRKSLSVCRLPNSQEPFLLLPRQSSRDSQPPLLSRDQHNRKSTAPRQSIGTLPENFSRHTSVESSISDDSFSAEQSNKQCTSSLSQAKCPSLKTLIHTSSKEQLPSLPRCFSRRESSPIKLQRGQPSMEQRQSGEQGKSLLVTSTTMRKL